MNRRTVTGGTALAAVLCGIVALASACGGGSTPSGPSPTNPVVRTVAPATGTTFGGTEITITGERFPAGAAVAVGGAPATNVAVVDATTIKAVTPPHASGAADVTVSGSTGSGVLPAAFTFVAPTGANTPPVIKSLTVKGRRSKEPAGFADLAETLDVTAVVEDAETPLDKLSFQWTADMGTFTGSGPVVTWTAPAGAANLPTQATLTLTVVETYKAADPSGLPVDKEYRVSTTSSVSVHNSAKEVGDMANDFLVAFSNSKIVDVDQVLRNFNTTCIGYADERKNVIDNRAGFYIDSYSIGTPSVTVNFGGTCPYRGIAGDACAQVPVEWHSTVLATGAKTVAKGTDQVAALYLNKRWWLCDSAFDAASSLQSGIVSGLRFTK